MTKKTSKNFIEENLNPNGKNEGDCVVRAISKSEDKEYEKIMYDLVHNMQDKECYKIPSHHNKYLTDNGYKMIMGNGAKELKRGNSRYGITTVNMAALLSQAIGQNILAVTNTHMAACLPDGKIYDSWDSARRKVIYFFIKDGENFLDEFEIKPQEFGTTWFERLPNGTAILHKNGQEVAKWKNGERI